MFEVSFSLAGLRLHFLTFDLHRMLAPSWILEIGTREVAGLWFGGLKPWPLDFWAFQNLEI